MLELEQEETLVCSSSYELPPNLAALLQRAWEQQQYQQYDQTPPTNGMDSKMLMMMVSGRRKTLLSFKTLCSVLQVMMNQNECDSYNIMPLMLMMINMGNNNQYNMMLALMMSMMNKVKIS